MKKGFTIVELLVVVAIVGILLGIVATATTGSIRNGRTRRAEAMERAFQQAIAAYYQQNGKWPDEIDNQSKSMGEKLTHTFNEDDTNKILREIVDKSVGANASRPLIDTSALFVANESRMSRKEGCFDNHHDQTISSYCGKNHCINGVDFSLAAKSGMSIGDMVFGYQGRTYGKFCRFWITYNAQTDSVKVSRKHPEKVYPVDWE